jgi:hypothetical protein
MIYITHEKSIGRSGHQFKDAITPLILAEMFGFTFLYNGYRSIEVFNLGEGRLSRDSLPSDISVHTVEGPHWQGASYENVLSEFSNLHAQYENQDCLVVLKNAYRVQLFQLYTWQRNGQLAGHVYERVVDMLRKNYRLRNPPSVSDANRNRTTIAVHVRRGDVADTKGRVPSSQHYAHGMEYYDSILKKLKDFLNDRHPEIRIFTELKSAEDVVAYCKESPDVVLYQGGKAEFADHFAQMVYSDILVVSNSSMSQVAGYLSEGLKIYHPNTHYHSLPEEEFIPFNQMNKARILQYMSNRAGD